MGDAVRCDRSRSQIRHAKRETRWRGMTIGCAVGLLHESKSAQTIDKIAIAIALSRLGRLRHGLLQRPLALARQRCAHLLGLLACRLVWRGEITD